MNEYYNGDNDNDVCDMDKMGVFPSNTNCWKINEHSRLRTFIIMLTF